MDETLNHFSDPQVCADLLKSVRWKDGIVHCPVCGSDDVFRHGDYQTCLNRYSCQACCRARGVQHATFTERTGTVFGHSKLPLTKWCQIIYLWKLKHNASEIATEVGVT